MYYKLVGQYTHHYLLCRNLTWLGHSQQLPQICSWQITHPLHEELYSPLSAVQYQFLIASCSTSCNIHSFLHIFNRDEPAKTQVFLDLVIKIEGSRIITSTYQKPVNLYFYLAVSSAHSKSMVKSAVYGLLHQSLSRMPNVLPTSNL